MSKAEMKKNNMYYREGYSNGYHRGKQEGFDRSLALFLFATMEVTNYRQNGLLKIWNRVVDISEALDIPETHLTMEDIYLCLAAEGGIVTDEANRNQARLALDASNGKPDKNYHKVIDSAMKVYETIIKMREMAEDGN